MKTTQYLDAVKAKLGIESDYALAQHLEMTRFGVSKLRTGVSVMSNTTAALVAQILGVPELRVIADCEIERGTNDVLWQNIAKKVAVVVLGALGLSLIPPSADAAARATTLHSENCARDVTEVHIAHHLRRFLAWLFGLPGFADGALA
jgi:hypothetical protein